MATARVAQGNIDIGKATGFEIIRKQKRKQKKQNEKVFPLMAFKAQLKRNVRSGVFWIFQSTGPIYAGVSVQLQQGFGAAAATLPGGFCRALARLPQGFGEAFLLSLELRRI